MQQYYILKYILPLLLIACLHSSAQKIYGTVYNSNGDLLPYASVTIKGTSIGASANNKAQFSFTMASGTYAIICQHVGYAAQEKNIVIKNTDQEIIFILTPQKLNLKEVIVKSGGQDAAYAIIKQAIKKRDFYNRQVSAFECDLYTKDIMKLRNLPQKILGQKIPDADKTEMGLDSSGKGIMYLSESIAKIHVQLPGKFKMEVLSSRVSGSGGFGFTFPTFINLYTNNVKIFRDKFNPRGFISPLADGALNFYKYKFLGSFFENGQEINSIKITPRRTYEPLFTGIINITDGDWRIHSCDLTLTTTAQLEIIDTLQITQIYVPVKNDLWRVKNQLLHFNFKQFGIDAIGNFVSVYSNYNLNPLFGHKYFNNVIIKYDTAVNKKTTPYWDSIRPVPLALDEKKDYQVKDSIYQLKKDIKLSKNSIDSLNKKQGKIKFLDIFWKGINRKHYTATNTTSWGVDALLRSVEFNSVQGWVISSDWNYNKYLKKIKSNFSIQPHFQYGLSNHRFYTWADVNFNTRDWETDKKIKRQTWFLSGGKQVSQFDKESPITELDNSINTLFWGDNFMKIYESNFASVGFTKRYENGFKFTVATLYEDRKPLNNTTNYVVFKKDTINLTPNYPYEKIDQQFTRHQAFNLSIDMSIKPGQHYIQFPNNKVAIGSKYPTISFNYTKSLQNIFGSDGNFDKWKFTIDDTKNFRLAGTLKYKIGMGGFLNAQKVFIQDYQHFIGNRSTSASDYVNSFQMASYYLNSTVANFFSFAHIEHHFNGLFTNKIPFIKKLNWNLVVGTNSFYVDKTSNYTDVFAGVENIFKIFRVDFVNSFANGKKAINGFRIGLGGVIGSTIIPDKKNKTISVNF